MMVLNRAGIKVPFVLDTPNQPNTADKEIVNFIEWLIKVKTGTVKLDEADKEALKTVTKMLEENEKP